MDFYRVLFFIAAMVAGFLCSAWLRARSRALAERALNVDLDLQSGQLRKGRIQMEAEANDLEARARRASEVLQKRAEDAERRATCEQRAHAILQKRVEIAVDALVSEDFEVDAAADIADVLLGYDISNPSEFEQLYNLLTRVRREVINATALHPEAGEVAKSVRLNESGAETVDDLVKECVQTAAMCMRMAIEVL